MLNTTLDTHAHLPNYKGCAILLHLIKNDTDIQDNYLRKAKERLIPDRQKGRGNKKYKNQNRAYRNKLT